MKIRINGHNVVLNVEHYDARTKVATVKIFGSMHKFQEHEYKIIEEN